MGVLQLLKRTAGSVTTPSSGKVALFFDSANAGTPTIKDDTGASTPLVGVPTVRQVNTGSGLTGGGDLSANRTIALSAASVAALTSVLNGQRSVVNILDFGADPTGAAASDDALDAAIAALPGGGIVLLSGTIRLARAPYIVAANNIELRGAGPNITTLKTTATTGDQIRLTGYGCSLRWVSIQGPGDATTSQKTAGVGVDVQSTEGVIADVTFAYQYDSLKIAGHLVDITGAFIRYFTNTGLIVDHQSDHRLTGITMNNAAATLPANAGIDVRRTASLVLEQLNIINSNVALNVSPATGVTIPSIKAVDCFFDTSAVGLNMTGAGAVFRSTFVDCWFSSMTTAGIRIQPASGGTVDGITFSACDVYNNVGGTTNGVLIGGSAGSVGKIKVSTCSIAGWTNGVNIAPAGTSFFPQIIDSTIGAVSSFAGNGTGITVATGTYKGLIINGNDVVDNTTANLTLGTVTLTAATAAAAQLYRIIDNPGINPRGTVTTPTVPASTVTVVNTTGFRVTVFIKGGVTSVVTVNGVATPSVLAAGGNLPVQLEPGGTIAVTYTTAFTWVWVGH